jgi:hypothetical protein
VEISDDDRCSIIDALGMLGDPRGIAPARAEAERKLLSRRRSGGEALRRLGDASGLAELRSRALERLGEPVRAALLAQDENAADKAAEEKLVAAVLASAENDRGLYADTLYEIASPLAVRAARALFERLPVGKPYVWRYAKSVLKRAMLRHDFVTLGLLAHAVERQALKSAGTHTAVKSGYDGKKRDTPIFTRPTQDYTRRMVWRFLKRLAQHRPDRYPHAAAEILIRYSLEDRVEPEGLFGEFSKSYLLHRILWGASARYTLASRATRFRFVSAAAAKQPARPGDESFSELWEAEPRAYLRVLGAARLSEAHVFAERAVREAHRAVLSAAGDEEVIPLLGAPYEPTVRLGLEELSRRFDPSRPDWVLLGRLVRDEREIVRELGMKWVAGTAPLWSRDVERVCDFLAIPDAKARGEIAALVVSALYGAPPETRRALATRLWALLRAPEASPGMHEGAAQVAREALLDELGPLTSLDELLALLDGGSIAAKAVAGALLGRRKDVVGELGMARVVYMAQHQVAAVREAAHSLIRGAVDELKADPSLLFVLAESEFADTRAFAFGLLRKEIDFASLGLDGIIALCDSNRVDVQEMGREVVLRHMDHLDPNEVLFRLSQHPHPGMKSFALSLSVRHLREGLIPLARLEGLFRGVLFDLWPERKVKEQAVDFLLARGLRDERQAEMAARVLSDFARTAGRADFERILEGLVRLKLAHPGVAAAISLPKAAES